MATSVEDVEKIAPRAEFRVFGRGVIDLVGTRIWEAGAVLRGVRRLPPETYFLSTLSGEAVVKLRDGLLDIKVKVGTTPEDYEIFQPQGKFAFPVARDDLAPALLALKVPIELVGDTFPVEALLAMALRHAELLPVTIVKTRYGFTVDGVIGEYAEVRFNGALMESACCESEDYAAMEQVTGALGLSGFESVNYLEAARRVVGMR